MTRGNKRGAAARGAGVDGSTRVAVARRVATRVLDRVTSEEAFASVLLDAELVRSGADARDAGLATAIVYGTLRVLPDIDAVLGRHLRQPDKLDAWTRSALRAAAFQLLYLSRVPPYAVVDDAVSLVRGERGGRLGGLVNAVLRKVAAARPDAPEPPALVRVPPWLASALSTSLGQARADAFLCARGLPPPIGLRVQTARTSVEALRDAIARARPEAQVRPSTFVPGALVVRGAGDPRTLPGWDEGWFAVQEEGAQAVGRLAGARPGERVADACAGRGGKTAQLAEAVGPEGHVTAIDLHERKLGRIGPELVRLGLPEVSVEALDLTVGTGGLEGQFDRVLVDAPCSGLGTLHRRPELLLRVHAEDPARLAGVQRSILDHALALLRPGGTLVFAVCSPTREEGVEVARSFEAAHPELERPPPPWPLPIAADADGVLRLGPWMEGDCDGMDAYQVARWTRG